MSKNEINVIFHGFANFLASLTVMILGFLPPIIPPQSVHNGNSKNIFMAEQRTRVRGTCGNSSQLNQSSITKVVASSAVIDSHGSTDDGQPVYNLQLNDAFNPNID